MRPLDTRFLKSCENCEWCLEEDYGYSNYTVEGVYIHCLVLAHPQSGFDRWYSQDYRLFYASQCDKYSEGDPVKLDVERDEMPDYKALLLLSTAYGTERQKPLLDAWEAREK